MRRCPVFSLPGGAVLGLLAAVAGPVPAAAPRAEILRLVPEDAGFCLVLSDLRDQAKKLQGTAWVKKFQDSPLVKGLSRAPEIKKLHQLEERLKKRLGVGFDRLRDDILGDAVVFAYRPGPPDKPELEQGVVLLWARDAKLLGQLVEAWNSDLKEVRKRTYKETTYFRRIPAQGKEAYYYLDGNLLAYSSHEEMVREVIDRKAAPRPDSATKKSPSLLEQLQRLGVGRALLVLWLNPRVFTPHISNEVKRAQGHQAHAFQTLLRYWETLEGAALTLSLDRDVEIKLAVRARPADLPEAARRFFTEATQASDVWKYFPPSALLVVAGRIDFVASSEFIGEFLPPKIRQGVRDRVNRGLEAGLGLDLFQDVLPNLGPDWGLGMTAPADKEVLIPNMAWALKVRAGNKKVAVDQALFNGLNSLALLAVFTFSQGDQGSELRFKSTTQGKVQVKYLENEKAFPRGYKPAFALKEGYLVLASSPEAVKEFSRGTAPPAEGDVPLLRLNIAGWSKFLKERRAALAVLIAGNEHSSRAEAERHLQEFLAVLDLLEGIELTQRTGAGQVTWTLRIRPADGSGK